MIDQSQFPWRPRQLSGNRMEIMLDQSPKMIRLKRRQFGFQFWQLRTPLTQYKIEGVYPYALDNGCFSGDLPSAWFRQIEEAQQIRPVFVTLPDVVGSASRTMDLFQVFEPMTRGLPRALVLQDGIDRVQIPFELIDAVFIGGSDEFKTAPEAFAAAQAARMAGKWVHVGRVNEPNRVHAWLGKADSIDGSGISRYDHMLESVVHAIKGTLPQRHLDFGEAA